VSRYGSDDRDAYDDTLQPNAECQDCSAPFSKAEDDPGVWCDFCSDKRDRWATALELRTMAKAVLRTDLTRVREVA